MRKRHGAQRRMAGHSFLDGVGSRGNCDHLVLAFSLENRGDGSQRWILIYVQDLALAEYGSVRSNEYYVSQYVDHSPLSHPDRGLVVASRQNQAIGERNPWCVIGSLGRGVSFATDALQVHGLSNRAGKPPDALMHGLSGKRLQHEHSLAAIQDAPIRWRRESEPSAASSAGSNQTIRRDVVAGFCFRRSRAGPARSDARSVAVASGATRVSRRACSARRPCSTPWN